jgi:BirA family transcriptional regulator, biotin operon repressor / biotin---[acetyl-CoA-carboxylase] ligase
MEKPTPGWGLARRQEDPGFAAPLDVEAIRSGISELRLGTPLLYIPAIDSTSTRVMKLAREGAPSGLMVITDEQTAGRGRIGRSWRSLPGKQLEFSLLLRPPFPAYFLVMASAVAVAYAIEAVAGIPAGIKWPNDVLVDDGYKVCGILIETTSDFVVLGIGLNVNGSLAEDPGLAEVATTLAAVAGRSLSREALAISLLRRLDLEYADLSKNGADAQKSTWTAWRSRLLSLGRRVSVTQGGVTISGVAEEVDASGSLLLRLEDGRQETVNWGDVSHQVRPGA